MTILDYSQIWSRLENLGELVKAERERTAKEDVDMEAKPVRKAEAEKEKGEKVVKTDKVLVGLKTSWAVAKAIGEVSGQCRLCNRLTRRVGQRRGQAVHDRRSKSEKECRKCVCLAFAVFAKETADRDRGFQTV